MLSWIDFSDLHLNPSDINGGYEGEINFRFRDKLKILESICNYAVSKRVDFIVDLGDTFDKSSIPSRYRLMYFDVLKKTIFRAKIPMIKLIGNHEKTAKDNVLRSEGGLIPDFYRVVDGECYITESEGIPLYFYPYFYESPTFSELPTDEQAVIFSHVEFSKIPIRIGSDKFIPAIKGSMAVGDFIKRFPMAIVRQGHYHQKMTAKNFYILGICSRTNMGECDFPLNAYHNIIDDNREFKSILIPIQDRAFKNVKITSNMDISNLRNGLDKTDVVLLQFEVDRKNPVLDISSIIGNINPLVSKLRWQVDYIYSAENEVELDLEKDGYFRAIDKALTIVTSEDELLKHGRNIIEEIIKS
jgi:hypothetical protein